MNIYAAPWSKTLLWVSVLTTLLCLGLATAALIRVAGQTPWLAALFLAIPMGSAVFTIRGYTIAPDAIYIRRLLWHTRLPLAELKSVRVQPDAMRRSLRLCGNGGLFSFTGFFRNATLGTYRAFVTDPRRAVVLSFARRTIVLSPDQPERFADDLTSIAPGLR